MEFLILVHSDHSIFQVEHECWKATGEPELYGACPAYKVFFFFEKTKRGSRNQTRIGPPSLSSGVTEI